MFALLNPAALLALLGLLVPVAIHLWNRRPGREVAVGSLRWLAAGANRRLRNLKLEQLWLLLLRAALLAVLAVAVAGPVWRQQQPSSRGVVLLSPQVLGKPAFAPLRPSIDSLRRRGYALRWLANGFPRVSGAMWRRNSTGDSSRLLAEAGRGTTKWQWARVQQATEAFVGQPLYVVTPAALSRFQGTHGPLQTNITWQILADTTTTSWLAAANTVGDSLRLLVGRSSETQTTFRLEKVRQQQPGQRVRVPRLPPLRYQPNPVSRGNMVLIPANTEANSAAGVTVRTVPMVIEIYATPVYAADARYLEAALRAAATGLAIPPHLRRVTVRPNKLTTMGWTFWLSEEALPAGWREEMRHGGHLWQEAIGSGVADTTRLATSGAAVNVFRREAQQQNVTSAVPLWTDARGRPVLSFQPIGHGAVYHLSTRLNPAWSELADNPELPAQLLTLLQPELGNSFSPATSPLDQPLLDAQLAVHDQRALDPSQLISTSTLQPHLTTSSPDFRTTDLRPWLVLAAGLLFLLERLLARRREAQNLSPAL
ncbi:hypothetical protein GCM10022409_36030 [Hymenobacter glaciei]|uniref:Aerotolerance regulator N-terminal domain-containing protein n=1 Tax=Hymenobacter glaciei TaxID=877209 RepID=A0ABP7ULF3_9BACT